MPDHTKHFGPREMRVEDAVSAMKYLPLTAEIRTKYMYNNLMYTAVSAALERASGLSLGDFLKERVWRVLGMRDTFWKLAEVQLEDAGEALATGYAWDESTGTYVAEQPPDFGGVSGAGAMISNVLDYAKWIRCMMTRSGPLSPAGHAALVEPRSVYLDHGTNPFPAPHLYALGWFMDMYRGERIIWHGGGITGFGSTMAYLPDRQWGVVMMGNTIRTSNYVQVILSMYLLDELVGTPLSERVDWGGVLRSHIEESRGWFANARERLYPSLPDPVIPSALRVEEYAGRYWHPAYRGVELKVDGEELVADRTSQEIAMNIRLEHVSGESWLATLEIVNQDPRDYEVVRAEFRVEADGVARYVGLDLESEMEGEKIWFERCR